MEPGFVRTRLLKLSRIEENLVDLQADLAGTVGSCPVCGAYRSADLEEPEAVKAIRSFLDWVRKAKESVDEE